MKLSWKLPDVGVLGYQALCLLAALVVFMLRAPYTYYLVNLLTLTIGIGAVASGMRIGPILYLGVLTFSVIIQRQLDNRWGPEPGPASGILLALAVLAFVAAHYRLQSLTYAILPVDRRYTRQAGNRTQIDRPTRSAQLVNTNEIVMLLLTLPLFALAAQFAWMWLSGERELPGISGDVGRLLLVIWVLGVAALLSAMVFAHWRRRQYDGVAAEMLLQDVLWRETRREQRRINRWYAYGWMRGGEIAQEQKSDVRSQR